MLEMNLREARRDELKEIAGFLGELFSLEADFDIDYHKQMRGLEMLLESPECRLYVLEFDNKLIGTVSLQRHISTSCGGYVGIVEDFFLHKDYRRKGIGTEVLTFLRTKAEEWGLLRLTLLADRNNTAALAFYEKTGWERTNLIPLFLIKSESYYP